MKSTKNQGKNLSNEELAEAYIFPHGLTKAEEKKEDEAFLTHRKKRLLEMTENQKMISRLLQLKFQIEDYIYSSHYSPMRSFSYFLKEYLKTIDRKKKDFANEIQVHETKLSQVLNDRVEPNDKFIIRLEIHSRNMFPAVYWFKLLEKKKEHMLLSDKKMRIEERKHVKNIIQFGA
ncbi:MAG: hypothetical protein M3R17_09640 [Bacteroidota bacterium]|nr:hypothetical protein [Bacteroidota bacterium]